MFRTWFLFSCACLVAVVFVGRLYSVQIVSGETYRDRVDRQNLANNHEIYDRGQISFETKDKKLVTAAGLKSGFLIIMDPEKVSDPSGSFEAISAHLNLDRKTFIESALKQNDNYEEIAKRVPEEVARAVDSLNLSGIYVKRERWRFYPAQSLASHAIGFVAYDADKQIGRYGLERQYESVLYRKPSSNNLNFFAEVFTNVKDSLIGDRKSEGNLVLTIEPTVQTYTETVLAEIMEKYLSDNAGIIIMDPRSGEILAMSSSPSFNPNEFNQVKEPAVFTNPLVEKVYEMGSIIKPLTIAAGLDAQVIRPETTYYDAGYLVLNNSRIQNYDGKGRGTVDMQVVLGKSLNTGVAFVAQKLGKEKFSEYFKSLFGSKTNIDLPSEGANLVENLNSPRDIEHATASYGQGIAMTPITAIRALASLGNGGLLVNPHLVKKIQYEIGFGESIQKSEPKRVFSKETSEEITRMLVKVVDENLLDGKVKMPQHSIAAKTGTAQIANPSGGGYYDDRYLHSFFGYFPAYDPKFIVFLYTVNPKNVEYASETLTLPFMDISKFLINYYGILPDRGVIND